MIKRTEFGEALRVLRGTRGYSQVELGKRSTVHHVTIARLEAGNIRPREETVRCLADALGVPQKALTRVRRRAPRRARRGAP